MAEIPAKISTCLSRTEQYRAHPQERPRAAEHPKAHGSRRQHDRPALARAVTHHVRAVEQPRPPGQKNRLGDERHHREQPDLRRAGEAQLLGEHQHQLRGQDQTAGAEDPHPQHVLAVGGILLQDLPQHPQGERLAQAAAGGFRGQQAELAPHAHGPIQPGPGEPRRRACAVQPARIDHVRLQRPAHQRRGGRHRDRIDDDNAPGDACQHVAWIVRGPDGRAHGEDARPQHPGRYDRGDRDEQSPGRPRGKRHAAHQQRKPGLQSDHQAHARAPVRQVGPHETQHVGKGRGAAHQRHGEIDHEARRDPGKVLLDQYRRGGALDQPEREAQKSPGENLAAEDAFRERAGSDDTALGHTGSLIARGRARILTR